MKRFAVIFILLVLAAGSALAQRDSSDFYVQSFKKLEWDLDARSNYPMLDQNNRKAALIKVVIPDSGFDFDVGVMGVVGVKQEVGEIWVYVPEGVRKMTIRHKGYGIIRDYEFDCPIESASVYELVLHVPRHQESKVIVRDSIVYVPTPVNVETPRKRKRLGISVLAVGSVPDPSFGVMAVWSPKRLGAYLKATGNLKPSNYSYTCHEDGTTDNGYIWTSGKGHVSKMTVTAGGIFRCLDWLSVSAGAGYGKRVLLWRDSKDDFAKVSEASAQGFAADLGSILCFGHITAYLGANTIGFKYFYPELGVGFNF